ncbi:hypothetical protein ACIP01_06185 [Pseudomonas monteilii]|uniref:hypothetical protein n=1 Tax=Pseudomonas monteilii TaxID=76759 RepID=UPI00380D053B
MDMNGTQPLRETLKKLDDTFRRYNLPGKDPTALRAVQQLCIDLKGEDGYISEKAGRIATVAGIYYSSGYLRHPGGESDLMSEMSFQLPNAIRSQISHLERLQREASD